MIEFVYWGLVLSSAIYLLVIMAITVGWYRIKTPSENRNKPVVPVSIVIAVRNEEFSILRLLKCLSNQDYPSSSFNVCIVDDHSDDDTKKIINDFITLNNDISIRLFDAVSEGKKKALKQGINQAAGELIITTDGDCEMGMNWLSKIVSFYSTTGCDLILGPVVYENPEKLHGKLFDLEFISLVASGAGSTGIGTAFMGNAANMAFTKEVYQQASDLYGDKYASGDDVFLIQQVAKRGKKNKIRFLKDTDAIVRTMAPVSYSEFFAQRIRWASKAKGYRSAWGVLVSLAVLSFNLFLTLSFLSGFFMSWMFVICFLFIVFKTLIDLPLLIDFTAFTNKRILRQLIPLSEILYPVYITIAAIVGLFFGFGWKGRKGLR